MERAVALTHPENLIYTITPATQADVTSISPYLRKADVDECIAATGLTPEEALTFSVTHSSMVYIVRTEDDKPICIFGVGSHPLDGAIGVPWMVATPLLLKFRKALQKEARAWIRKMHDQYSTLTNIVDARNVVHVRWLRWMGFTLHPPVKGLGAAAHIPFIPFTRTIDTCV